MTVKPIFNRLLGLGPVTFVVEYEMTPRPQRRLDSDDDGIKQESDVELVEDSFAPLDEAVEEKEETDEKPSIRGE